MISEAVVKANPICNDPIFKACYEVALKSTCKKLKFGSVLVRNSKIELADCNRVLGPLKSFCDSNCIRFSIQSRTESMLGACGHAEENLLWKAVRRGIPLSECDIYILGLNMDNVPMFETKADYTCLRCGLQMYNSGIQKIFMPFRDKWVGIPAEEALIQAKQYANGEKTI